MLKLFKMVTGRKRLSRETMSVVHVGVIGESAWKLCRRSRNASAGDGVDELKAAVRRR